MFSTNYFNTFIEIAEDCKATSGKVPLVGAKGKSIANWEYELLVGNPYQYTSDDVIFQIFAERNQIRESRLTEQRELFFSKERPCLRASLLTKTYGWGVHSDREGRIAIYGVGSEEYNMRLKDMRVVKTKAMRSKRARYKSIAIMDLSKSAEPYMY